MITTTKPKLKVGDRVFVESRVRYKTTGEYIVEKVGRKYFTLQHLPYDRFDLETWSQDSAGSKNLYLWASEADYQSERSRVELWASIKRNHFDLYSCPSNLTGDQLQRIAIILQEGKP